MIYRYNYLQDFSHLYKDIEFNNCFYYFKIDNIFYAYSFKDNSDFIDKIQSVNLIDDKLVYNEVSNECKIELIKNFFTEAIQDAGDCTTIVRKRNKEIYRYQTKVISINFINAFSIVWNNFINLQDNQSGLKEVILNSKKHQKSIQFINDLLFEEIIPSSNFDLVSLVIEPVPMSIYKELKVTIRIDSCNFVVFSYLEEDDVFCISIHNYEDCNNIPTILNINESNYTEHGNCYQIFFTKKFMEMNEICIGQCNDIYTTGTLQVDINEEDSKKSRLFYEENEKQHFCCINKANDIDRIFNVRDVTPLYHIDSPSILLFRNHQESLNNEIKNILENN
jgi:hypothetical protein